MVQVIHHGPDHAETHLLSAVALQGLTGKAVGSGEWGEREGAGTKTSFVMTCDEGEGMQRVKIVL